MPAAVGIGGTQGTVIPRVSVEVAAVDICGAHGVDCCTGGENGGAIDGKRSGGTDDNNEVRNEVGRVDGTGCGASGMPRVLHARVRRQASRTGARAFLRRGRKGPGGPCGF